MVRIFGRPRHRPSTTWRKATDRAFTLIGDGRYEDAGALLTRAADLEPWLSESWYNLALLHKFRRDWGQARAAGPGRICPRPMTSMTASSGPTTAPASA